MEHQKSAGSLGSFISGALAATAVAGFMLFTSKNAKKNREAVEEWVEDAKTDVLKGLKKVKRLSREKYDDIVDTVSDKYSQMKNVGSEKADDLREELKSRWEEVMREAEEEEKRKDRR